MEGLFIFAVVVAGIWYGLRYLRQREIEAFRDADLTEFQAFARRQSEEAKKPEDEALMARAEAFSALNPGVVELKKEEGTEAQEVSGLTAPDPTLYRLKDSPFDELTRHITTLLADAAAPAMLLRDVPLSEFVRAEAGRGSGLRLSTTRVRYLVVDRSDMSPLCGIELNDGRQDLEFIRGVFGDAGLPLLKYPPSLNLSEAEVRDQLDPIVRAGVAPECPRCGGAMTLRRAVKGRNEGSVFWVCPDFPRCRGIVRADQVA